MKLCVQTGGLSEKLGAVEAIRIIKEAGFDCVDLNLDHTLTHSQIRAGQRSRWCDNGMEGFMKFVNPIKDALDRYGLAVNQIHAPFPCYTGNAGMDAYVRNATEYTIRAAKVLDCRYVVVHEGFPRVSELKSKKEIFDWNIAFYTSLIPVARESDVVICLENLFSSYEKSGIKKIYAGECADMEEAVKYIDTLNGIAGEERFGFCLDTGHANLMGKRMYDCLMTLGPRLKVLHVHDNNGMADQHLFPYNGIIMWDDFLNGIRDCGYRGALNFETFAQIMACDNELIPDEMRLLHAIGKMFVRRIEA